jgi:uncharacterized protein (TIGR03503 family)
MNNASIWSQNQGNASGEDRDYSMSKLLSLLVLILCIAWVKDASALVVPSSTAAELKNRFRVDHMVDKLTLMVQREYGSPPVIIVLPDGSKWYAQRHPDDVKWVDGITGDIIEIPNPVPGPWQLLGRVAKGSTIDKVSKLDIVVDPFPQPLFQGERIKVTAKLMGDEQRVRMPGLDYLVEWTAKFVSEHSSADENFAAGTFVVGSYKDDGEALDERPDDGIFTGKLNLNQPWGDYRFVVNARNNVFEREVTHYFTLSPNPVEVKMIEPADPYQNPWKLVLSVESKELNLADTFFEFEMVGPAGLQQSLTVHGMTTPMTELQLPMVTEFGSYRIKGQAASTTVGGREVLIQLPEHFFNLVPPPEPPPTPEELAAIAAEQAAIAEAKAKEDAIFWLILGNLLLLVFGVAGLIFWRKRQTLAQALAIAQANALAAAAKETAEPPSVDDVDLTVPDPDDAR